MRNEEQPFQCRQANTLGYYRLDPFIIDSPPLVVAEGNVDEDLDDLVLVSPT